MSEVVIISERDNRPKKRINQLIRSSEYTRYEKPSVVLH